MTLQSNLPPQSVKRVIGYQQKSRRRFQRELIGGSQDDHEEKVFLKGNYLELWNAKTRKSPKLVWENTQRGKFILIFIFDLISSLPKTEFQNHRLTALQSFWNCQETNNRKTLNMAPNIVNYQKVHNQCLDIIEENPIQNQIKELIIVLSIFKVLLRKS